MNEKASSTLESLKDLEGVVGSFLVGPSGGIIAQDLPSYFGSAAYDVGPRALRLAEALSISEGEFSNCTLRCGEHRISLRPTRGALLAIIASADVNVAALRMAVNLVARKLAQTPLDAEIANSVPPPPTIRPAPSQASSSRSVGAPEAVGTRPAKHRPLYFRGKRVQ